MQNQFLHPVILAFVAFVLIAAPLSAQADLYPSEDTTQGRPSFSATAGTRVSAAGASILLNLGFEYRQAEDTIAPGALHPPQEMQVIARISASGAIQPGRDGAAQLPYLEITFEAYEAQIELANSADDPQVDTQYASLAFGAMGFKRNLEIDQSWNVTLSAARGQLGVIKGDPNVLAFYAQAALDVLGAKVVAHSRDILPTFAGVHIAGLAGEIGAMLKARPLTIRFAVGGAADINWWGKHAMSDMAVYAAIRASITEFVEIWAKGSLNAWWDSQADGFFKGGPQLMVGVTASY